MAVFLYQGRPAILDTDQAGLKCRLKVFDDGDWHDRGEVGIPGKGRTWIENRETGKMELQPRFDGTDRLAPFLNEFVDVVTVNNTDHVFYQDRIADFVSYREGLDLIPNDTASALAPENVAADTTGWSKLDINAKMGMFSVAHHRGRLIIANQEQQTRPIEFWEKSLQFGSYVIARTAVCRGCSTAHDPAGDHVHDDQQSPSAAWGFDGGHDGCRKPPSRQCRVRHSECGVKNNIELAFLIFNSALHTRHSALGEPMTLGICRPSDHCVAKLLRAVTVLRLNQGMTLQ
jgi:hypothetical protein